MPVPQFGDALFVDLPRVRLDGGAKAFRQRWGYELSPPPPLLEEEEGEGCEADGEGEPAETASLREEGTVHTASPLGEFREWVCCAETQGGVAGSRVRWVGHVARIVESRGCGWGSCRG